MKLLLATLAMVIATARPVPADDRAGNPSPSLSITIAPDKTPAGAAVIDRRAGFSVLFTNRSDKPIRLWDRDCQLGYETLSFHYEEEKGRPSRMYLLPRHASDWKNKPPKTVEIPPASTFSWKVQPSRIWTGVPEPNTGKPVSLTAFFEINSSDVAKVHGVWIGRVTSEAVAMLVIDPKLTTPHEYLESGCPKQALSIMKADPTWVKKTDTNRQTPLHIAARYGHLGVIRWLLANGADVNARAYNNFTALHFAREPEIVKILLAHQSDVNASSVGGTGLQEAAEYYARCEEIPVSRPELDKALAVTRLLIDAGADYDIRSACLLGDVKRIRLLLENKRLAHDKGAMRAAATHGRTEVVKLMLQSGADPEDADYGGLTVSYFAIEHADVLKVLFEAGADPKVTVEYHGDGQGPQGTTLLHTAARKGAVETAKLLLELGMDVDPTTPQGWTPLHGACGEGHLAMVQCLLEHKANPTTRSETGWTPMSVAESAIQPKNEEDNVRLQAVIRALQRAGVESDLCAAIACDDIQQVGEILKADPKSMERRNPQGRPPLHRAVTLNRLAITKLLLESGCNPDIRSEDEESGLADETALHDAAFWGHLEIAKMLITHGADVNARATQNVAPLHQAARLRHPEFVRLLLKHGADVNAEDDEGGTPLDWGNSFGGSPEMSELLRSHGGVGKNSK